uniref:Nucleotide-diphospho-sugar transferase domain-containing protein n=1 Tax=viral metagenome TaxID=1070528 RepID=A0A6C0BRN2_9ZZZZ
MKIDYSKYLITLAVVIGTGMLYNRYQESEKRKLSKDNYELIKKYILNDSSLANLKKPIIWIHIPYSKNAREWDSFGSRLTLNLNQPYLNLTIKTLIEKCGKSFHICIIDDETFENLLPGWNLDITKVGEPIAGYIRELGMMNLLYNYGGMIVPPSFICLKNLKNMYEDGTKKENLFMCEMLNRSKSSDVLTHSPNTKFMGADKENPIVFESIKYLEKLISSDQSAQPLVMDNLNAWYILRLRNNDKITVVSGRKIGTKLTNDKPLGLEELFASDNEYLPTAGYGVYIPSSEVLLRQKYQWFARLSEKEILDSDMVVSKYFNQSLS